MKRYLLLTLLFIVPVLTASTQNPVKKEIKPILGIGLIGGDAGQDRAQVADQYPEQLDAHGADGVQLRVAAVLLGDHTCVAKDGRKMPCVVSMRQHSETQSKPSYFRGHFWGAIGMLIGSLKSPFCIPLDLRIHQGLVHVGENNQTENDRETLGTRIIQMAIDFSVRHDLRSILTLDAFFPKCGSFQVG